jgi:hypothetical protein
MSTSSKLVDLQGIKLAQDDQTEAARQRASKRLVQDRKPGAAAASSDSSWVDWNQESTFLGQPWDMSKIPLNKLEQMRRDPILAFALMFVKVPLIRAPWYIKCSDPKIAAAVDASLRKIYGRFILAYANSMDFGFSPMVKRFEYEEKPDWVYIDKDNPDKNEQPVWTNSVVKPIVWKPFTALNPRRCAPHWNAKGEFSGIDFSQAGMSSPFFTSGRPWNIGENAFDYQGSQGKIADVPLDWALWATNEKDSVFGSYWGYPRIGYAYRFWWAYWYRFGVADRAFEKWGDPPVLVYHPDDPLAVDDDGNPVDYTSAALGLAESVRSGANVAMPSGVVTSLDEKTTNQREWAIEQMQVKTDFSSIVEQFRYLDTQKLRAVMVPEQALIEGEGGTSSRNVASTFGELFQESMAVVKEEIDDHLNRWVIPQFVEQNFGTDSPKAEIVTTGFEQLDMENMRAVLQLVGQRKLLSVVDERELAERMNIPVVSREEAAKRLKEAAAEAEAAIPAPQGPVSDAAGVNADGRYYQGREQINFSDRTTMPYLIERVDELPEDSPPAYFDSASRTLYVRKDADPKSVTGYLIGLSKEAEESGTSLPDNIELVLAEFKRVSDRIDELSAKDSNIHVELQQPQPEESNFDTEREVLERDSEGLIKRIVERKVPREPADS